MKLSKHNLSRRFTSRAYSMTSILLLLQLRPSTVLFQASFPRLFFAPVRDTETGEFLCCFCVICADPNFMSAICFVLADPDFVSIYEIGNYMYIFFREISVEESSCGQVRHMPTSSCAHTVIKSDLN